MAWHPASSYPRRFIAAKLGLTLLLFAGCARPVPQPTGPTLAPVPHAELESLWDASLHVLRRHDLYPDRQDRALGVISTFPSTSQGVGEFWRQDVADPYSLVQSTIQTIRRQATVKFLRRDGDQWDIDIQVEVFREARPESQVTNASSCFQAFSGLLPTYEGLIQNLQAAPGPTPFGGQTSLDLSVSSPLTQPKSWWVPLGRDGALENSMLDEILARAGLDAPEPTSEPATQEPPSQVN